MVNGSVSIQGVHGTVSGHVGAMWRHCNVFFITSRGSLSLLYLMMSFKGSPEEPKQRKPERKNML